MAIVQGHFTTMLQPGLRRIFGSAYNSNWAGVSFQQLGGLQVPTHLVQQHQAANYQAQLGALSQQMSQQALQQQMAMLTQQTAQRTGVSALFQGLGGQGLGGRSMLASVMDEISRHFVNADDFDDLDDYEIALFERG